MCDGNMTCAMPMNIARIILLVNTLEQTHWHPKPMWQQENFNHYGTFMTTNDSRPYALFPVSCGSLQTGRCQVD